MFSSVSLSEPYDRAASPGGDWIAEKRTVDRGDYLGDETRIFVHRRTEGDNLDPDGGLRIRSADSVGFIWIDDQHLLIAGSRDDDFDERPSRIAEISLAYSLYPTTDPGQVRDQTALKISHKEIEARYLFSSQDTAGAGLPGAGCELYAEADAGTDIKKIKLRISAYKVPKAMAWDAGRIVDVAAHVGAGILFYAEGDDTRPIGFVTAAGLDDIEVDKGGLATDRWMRSHAPMSNWQIMWGLSASGLQKAIDRFRSGRFEIRLGYWFDNKEIKYVNRPEGSTLPIEDFKRCIRENAIFPLLH